MFFSHEIHLCAEGQPWPVCHAKSPIRSQNRVEVGLKGLVFKLPDEFHSFCQKIHRKRKRLVEKILASRFLTASTTDHEDVAGTAA